jgi:predicted Rossmann fold nucleotide-binding protein DprA/Smf involved in DNA uptake
MTFINALVESLDARLAQLHGEIGALVQAREALISNGASLVAAKPPRARRQTSPRRKGARRSPKNAALADTLHALLAAGEEGLSTSALSAEAGVDVAQVLAKLRELEAAGGVRRTGQRRGTRWHASGSEEGWIARRAAELAARARHR